MKEIRSQIKIVDNFLTPTGLEMLSKLTQKAGAEEWRIFWVLSDIVDNTGDDNDELHNSQLVHNFDDMGTMHHLEEAGVLDRLGCLHVCRAKMNIGFRTKTNLTSQFHVDLCSREYHAGLTEVDELTGVGVMTAFLYINSCDGGTMFEDGTFIKSKANRLVEFPRELKHAGVSTTDAPRRTVLNLNYIPLNYFPAHGKNRFKDGD